MPSIPTSRLPYNAIEKFEDYSFIPDDTFLYFGTDGDVSLEYDEDGDNLLFLTGDTNIPHLITNTSTAVAGGTLAIPVTTGLVSKTTGGVEALTLADGTDGQILQITLAVDGGTGTLTPSTSTGWATIVFADAGDTASLLFVNGTIGWVILSVWGLAAPPAVTV